jgi:lambda family phage portal protein
MRAGEYSSYETASQFLQMATWVASGGDADAVEYERTELVRRCWDLYRNNPLATGAVDTVVDNVVGTGLRMQARIDAARLGLTQDQADQWEADVEARFEAWASRPDECDLEQRLTFVDHQRLALTTALCAGDALISLPSVRRPGTMHSTRIQAIDPGRMTNPHNAVDTMQLTGGVERDRYGAPSRYHVLYAHPDSAKVDAHIQRWMGLRARGTFTGRRNVVHLFRAMRPGQTRGVPFLAPVGGKLKQLDRYTDAEIVAAVVAGLFAVFVKTEDGEGLGHGEDSELAQNVAHNPALQKTSVQTLTPGMVADLAPNETVESVNPGRPNGNFGGFFEAIALQIGAGTGIPLEILLKHFRRSYSASRGARLEANRMFMSRRRWMAAACCQPIYETWLMEQIEEGRIRAPGFLEDPEKRALWSRADWIGPSSGQLDPVKETQAEFMAFELTATSLSDITQRLYGQSHEVVVHRIGRERRLLAREGVPIPSRGNQEEETEFPSDGDDGPEGAGEG